MGLALGYQSAIVPAAIISLIVFVGFKSLGMFGIALSALGMLSTLATCLSIDVFGPVCDNAGGIAEMSHCHEDVRKKTDSLDAAGNTTAAIGKGFAIGSAALVSLALFGAFTTKTVFLESFGVNVLRPVTFAFLILGAMLPYWFTAMTMKSVGKAAGAMVEEVKRQFQNNPDLLSGKNGAKPDYATCIAISTKASLREMILPGLLVMLSPIVTGTFFGVEAVCGLLSGALVSGVQMAISQSNTGGAWDNAKKYIEKGELIIGTKRVTKGGIEHKAAVVGDTVGDPLKDTSGPALNILMKLMAIISLVFSGFFLSINDGKGAFDIQSWEEAYNEMNADRTVWTP
jgi:inorganic pyrophosphatase